MMDGAQFTTLFAKHRDKISEAWIKLSDADLDWVAGDLDRFLQKVREVYHIPLETIMHELDAVQTNIDEGITADYAPPLHPEE